MCESESGGGGGLNKFLGESRPEYGRGGEHIARVELVLGSQTCPVYLCILFCR